MSRHGRVESAILAAVATGPVLFSELVNPRDRAAYESHRRAMRKLEGQGLVTVGNRYSLHGRDWLIVPKAPA